MSTVVLTDDYRKSGLGRAVPGSHFDRNEGAWVLHEPTPRAAAVALKLFPELVLSNPELADERDKLGGDVRPVDNAAEFATDIEAPAVSWALDDAGFDFYRFQSLDLGYLAAVLEAHGGAYLGWERGLGKTLGACALIDALCCERVLVVAPNTAKSSVWEPELRKWLGDERPIRVLPNDKVKRQRLMSREVARKDEPLILVAHYESLAILEREAWTRRLGEWDMVIADEAHRLKNPKAKMVRALKKVPTKRKLALSGSIIENHAEELFSPLQWLFPDTYKSKWRDWNDRYLDFVEGGYSRICVGVKPERLEELRNELGVFMVYRRKEDELDLPRRIDQQFFVELSPGQRKVYDGLRDECLAVLDDGTKIKAAEGLSMLASLRRVATGLDLISPDVEDSAKLDLVLDLVLDAQEPTVVFGWYKASVRAVANRLREQGLECFVVDGDVKPEIRADFIERFQAGEGDVFCGTLATLGESVTLTRATQAILIDRDWNPATNVQAEDRIYRIGQERPVTISHIIARDTVDELRVSPTIANKEALRRLILGSNK